MTSIQIPSPLAWKDRHPTILPLLGGYSGYITSLRDIAVWVNGEGVSSKEQLVAWMRDRFEITDKSASSKVGFLLRCGLLESDADNLALNDQVRRWVDNHEDWIPVAIVHSRIKFVGELLAHLHEPKTPAELCTTAAQFGLMWRDERRPESSKYALAQINYRRGWLQSAKLIDEVDGRLTLTGAGRNLLARLQTHNPSPDDAQIQDSTPEDKTPARSVDKIPSDADRFAAEITSAETDSSNPTRFERAVRAAFDSMGFDAKHLGSPGQTDVLITARLGKDQSYRVAIDAKTASSGSVSPGQVDWDSLKDHREKHNATYSLLVGPNPSNKRLIDRARNHSVAILPSNVLADLTRRHVHAPLSLLDYKTIFEANGEVNLQYVDSKAKRYGELRQLASVLWTKLAETSQIRGRMTARDLHVLLGQTAFKDVCESEIERLLQMLSHPLVGGLDGCSGTGYVVATSPKVWARRIRLLGDEIAGGEA